MPGPFLFTPLASGVFWGIPNQQRPRNRSTRRNRQTLLEVSGKGETPAPCRTMPGLPTTGQSYATSGPPLAKSGDRALTDARSRCLAFPRQRIAIRGQSQGE